jgi:serine/threonine-protein kinase
VSALKVCPQCGTEYPANARFCEIDGTALRSETQSSGLEGTIVADRYHVLKKLGEGGMGEVYLAEHVKMGRKSALKVMHAGMKESVDAVSRFNREAANASRIAHTNVAAVYDFGETPEGLIYLAMEFVDGPPLSEVIRTEGALPLRRAANIVSQIAEGLAVAHDMGIVHRDLKPDNIMITKNRDGSDCVKVVDFGIAKAAENAAQKVTKTGRVIGTPEYMSPEQLSGDKLDGRSDVYSLGIVAFNLLTGELPFPGESSQESMIMRLTDKPKTLAEMYPTVAWSADVQAVMDKVLERDMTLRFQNAPDFGNALYNAIDRMPTAPTAAAGGIAGANAPAGAIPATRIAPAHAPSVAGTANTGGASNKGKVWAIGSAVAAVIVVGGVLAFKTMGAKQSLVDSTRTTPAVTTPTAPATPAGRAGTQTSSTVAQPEAPPATHANSTAPANFENTLVNMVDDSRDPARAAAVRAKLAALQPKLSTSKELLLAATLRSNVYATSGDTTKACDELRSVKPKLNSDDAENANAKLVRLLCNP